MTRKVTTIALVVFVALGMLSIGAPSAFAQQDAAVQNETNQTNATETNQTNATAQAAEVTIENQTSNGSAITVNSTTVPEGGFLVVYNATLAAPLGNSSSLDNGSQENVNVTLNQSLTENTTVLVAAFQDNNTNDQFDLGTDEVYMSNGQPVIDAATVNVTSAGNATAPANATTPTPANETTPVNETAPEDEPEDDDTDEDDVDDDEPFIN